MKAFVTLAVLPVFLNPAHAADAPRPLNPQQLLMKRCQQEATASGKKGPERQSLVNACLADGKKRQQETMKACAAENKGKKGEEYKKAQAACLSKS